VSEDQRPEPESWQPLRVGFVEPDVTLVWGPSVWPGTIACVGCVKELPLYWASTRPGCHYGSPTCAMMYGVETSWCCSPPVGTGVTMHGEKLCIACMVERLRSLGIYDARWVIDSDSYKPSCKQCSFPVEAHEVVYPHACDHCTNYGMG
jgi:hypothetical protein